ncbi:MAG: hypothetical protein QNK05_14935 [Myxococcota bacterium]|nr:hypothetical protein [Myxococcota bacterium]
MQWFASSDPRREVWRQLLELANLDLALSHIESIHGSDPRHSRNREKQASQLRVALIQAREYFEVAERASLLTRPNHLFYGAVALTTALMLLRGDGTKSLDAVRRAPGGRQHGLELSVGLNAGDAANRLSLLERVSVEVRPRGHFANWIACQLALERDFVRTDTIDTAGSTQTRMEQVGTLRRPRFGELQGSKRTLLRLCQQLPDLHHDLARFRIGPPCSRVSVRRVCYENRSRPETIKWYVHSAAEATQLWLILEKFRLPARDAIGSLDALVDEDRASAIVEASIEHLSGQLSYPDIRRAADGSSIIYGRELGTSELCDAYMLAYALSMLARYYPDLWVSCIESHCLAAKVIELAVETLVTKIPLIVLGEMRDTAVVVSSQAPPWQSW